MDIRDDIIQFLKKEDRSILWLSKKSKINYNTLYGCLIKKRHLLSNDKIFIINSILGTNFSNKMSKSISS